MNVYIAVNCYDDERRGEDGLDWIKLLSNRLQLLDVISIITLIKKVKYNRKTFILQKYWNHKETIATVHRLSNLSRQYKICNTEKCYTSIFFIVIKNPIWYSIQKND
jgi:hypothetical protein